MSERKTVLLIDDDEVMLELLEILVDAEGYDSQKVLNFEDGMEAVKLNSFAYVIADVFMTGMGGIEGIRQLKQLDPFIPVMAISGGFHEMSGDNAVEAPKTVGADTGLAKPFDTEQFSEAFAALRACGIT